MAEVTKLFGDGIVFLTTYAVIGLALGTVVRLGIWMAEPCNIFTDGQNGFTCNGPNC